MSVEEGVSHVRVILTFDEDPNDPSAPGHIEITNEGENHTDSKLVQYIVKEVPVYANQDSDSVSNIENTDKGDDKPNNAGMIAGIVIAVVVVVVIICVVV